MKEVKPFDLVRYTSLPGRRGQQFATTPLKPCCGNQRRQVVGSKVKAEESLTRLFPTNGSGIHHGRLFGNCAPVNI